MNSPKKHTVYIDPDLRELIPGFLENRKKDLVSLEKFFVEEDFQSIAELAHTIKGSGGGYGFDLLTDLGRSMEEACKKKDASTIKNCLETMEQFLDSVEIVFRRS